MALLTRYVGVSVLVVAVLAVAAVGDRARRERWRDATVIATIGVAPFFAWSAYTSFVLHAVTARTLRYHYVRGAVSSTLGVVEGWLMPTSWPSSTRHALLAVFVVAVIGLFISNRSRTSGAEPQTRLNSILGGFAIVYFAVVVLSRYVFDRSVPIDARILAPLQPILYVLVVSLLWWTLQSRTRLRPPAIAACCLAVIVGPIVVGVSESRTLVAHGFRPSEQTELTRAVRNLPRNQFIASNIPELISLEAGRASIILPMRVNPITDLQNRRFDVQIRELGRVVAQRRGVVVLYNAAFAALSFPNLEQLQRLTPLRPIVTVKDGVIAGVPAGAS
jgi:hypothetical protein